jgi:hypothetical protein
LPSTGGLAQVSYELREAVVVVHQQDAGRLVAHHPEACGTPRGMDNQSPAPASSAWSPHRTIICPSSRKELSSRSWCRCRGGAAPAGSVISSTTGPVPDAVRCSTTRVSRNHHACPSLVCGESPTAAVLLMETPPGSENS